MRRFALRTATTTGATALTVATAVLASRHRAEGVADGVSWVIAFQAAVALSLVGAAAVAGLRRNTTTSGLLVAAAVALDAGALPLPDAGGALLFSLAIVLGAAAPAFAAAAALSIERDAGLLSRVVAAAIVGAATVWVGLVPATLFDGDAAGCFRCPSNLVLVHNAPTLRNHILHSGLRATAVLSILLAIALLAGLMRRGREQSTSSIALIGAAGALCATAVSSWHQAAARVATTDGVVRVTWIVACAGVLLVAAAPVSEFVRARIVRARIVDAVLRTVPSAEDLRTTLAANAGDRSLALVFPRSGREPVDGDGRPVAAVGNGTVVTEVVRAGDVVAELRHERLSGLAASRLAESVHAAGLAIEHTSSRARLRAELTDLSASRARIVEVADAERRRLERNLHDGAQQRLIALSVALAGESDARAADARAEVLGALDDLRELAHGIHPASLSDGGILPSLRELAEGSSVPLRLDLRPLERLPIALESAVYRVVADAVQASERHGNGSAVTIALEMTDREVVAELKLPGVNAGDARRALSHAADRVSAVGGELTVAQGVQETVVGIRL